MDESEDDRRAFSRALFFIALGAAAFGIYFLGQLPGVLDEMRHVPRMTCDDLVRNGPAGHRYVAVTDARLSDRKSVSERDSDTGALELYHAVYPAGLGQEPEPRDLKLVLCIMDEGERRRVRDDRNRRTEEGRPGLDEFTCAVHKADRLPAWARTGLAATYPNIRLDDCWLLVIGEAEPTPAYARRLALYGGVASLSSILIFAWLWLRRGRNPEA